MASSAELEIAAANCGAMDKKGGPWPWCAPPTFMLLLDVTIVIVALAAHPV